MDTNELLKIARWQFKSQTEIDLFYDLVATIGLPMKSFVETPQFLIFKSDPAVGSLSSAAEAVASLGYSVELISSTGTPLQASTSSISHIGGRVRSASSNNSPPPLPNTEVEKTPLIRPTNRTTPPPRLDNAVTLAPPTRPSKQVAPPPLPYKEVTVAPPPRPSTQTAPPPLPNKVAAITTPVPPSKPVAPPLPNKKVKMAPPPRPSTQAAPSSSQSKVTEMAQRTPPSRRRAPPALPNSDEIVSGIEVVHTADDTTQLGVSDGGALIEQHVVSEKVIYESFGGYAKNAILAVLLLLLMISGISYYWFFGEESPTVLDQSDGTDSPATVEDGQNGNGADIQDLTPNETSVLGQAPQRTPTKRKGLVAEAKKSATPETASNLVIGTEATSRTQSIPMIDESRGPAPITPPASWFKLSDIPERKKAKGLQTSISYTLTIGIKGEVVGCRASESNPQGLSDMFCGKVSSRAKFEPAQGQNGKPVTGEYQSAIKINVTAAKAEPKSGCFERGASGLTGTLC